LALPAAAAATTPFTVEAIEIEGADRLSEGTVLNYLPVRQGERLEAGDAGRAIRALYDAGLFKDAALARRGNTLVVQVTERPAIGEINLEGDFSIKKEKLRQILKDIGLAEGRIFDRSVLDRVRKSLQRQMFSRGKYAVELSVDERELERNRVAIDITLNEGKTARIRSIQIIGNEAFSDATLTGLMESAQANEAGWLSSADEYSRTTLQGDIEAIRSYYLDRGYINFTVTSSPVTITPDKKSIYITLNVDEGKQYKIDNIELAGDLPIDAAELRKQISIHSGDLFSRKAVTSSKQAISDELARAGYTFAKVRVRPEIDEASQTVDITLAVEPGERVYVRRIVFMGHTATRDRVFRREMRQLEGGLYSPARAERSRVRIQRLASVRNVSVETQKVQGRSDLIDVRYRITERRTGSLSFGAGFSSNQGVTLNASIREKNLLGTGKDLTLRLDNSQRQRQVRLSYSNPYYTEMGVGRSWRLRYRETNPNNIADTAEYFSDNAEAGVSLGIPTSEFNTVNLGLSFEGTRIRTTGATPQSFRDFLDENGREYAFLTAETGWSRDTRNRTIFPESGAKNTISLETALPESDLTLYQVTYRFEGYVPLAERLVGQADWRVSGGDGYGDSEGLPFFRHYFAGGIRSVRGYAPSSLGPEEEGDAIGGDLVTSASVQLIFPPPFATRTGQTRLSLFYDFGNVYRDYDAFDASALRSAAGIALNWRSPVGPLSFSYANAIDPRPGDDTESFQFTIGTFF
jgi:outer membrane protein insertion porin family